MMQLSIHPACQRFTRLVATGEPQRSRAEALAAASSSQSCWDNTHLGRAALGPAETARCSPPTEMTHQVSTLYLQGLKAADRLKPQALAWLLCSNLL